MVQNTFIQLTSGDDHLLRFLLLDQLQPEISWSYPFSGAIDWHKITYAYSGQEKLRLVSTLPFDGLLASESTFIHSAMIDTKLAAQSPKSSKAQIQENNIERSNKKSYFTSSRWISKVAQMPHEIAEDDPRIGCHPKP